MHNVPVNAILEFFNLQDALPLLALIVLLRFAAARIGSGGSAAWWARGFAAAAFLGYAVAAIDVWKPATPEEFLTLGLQALLAMGVVHGLAGVVLPVFGFIYRYFWAGPAAKRREWAEQRQREQAAEREAEAQAESARAEQSMREERERQRQQELANRPPPPTREERLAEAKHRYEATVRMLENAQMDAVELQAARDKAKQRYLRDIDEVLK